MGATSNAVRSDRRRESERGISPTTKGSKAVTSRAQAPACTRAEARERTGTDREQKAALSPDFGDDKEKQQGEAQRARDVRRTHELPPAPQRLPVGQRVKVRSSMSWLKLLMGQVEMDFHW
jgi:hypothetical protein